LNIQKLEEDGEVPESKKKPEGEEKKLELESEPEPSLPVLVMYFVISSHV
jgi:hypothetical protein